MTPRRFRLWVEARLRAAETAQRARAWLAWHTAALPLQKKFPPFERFVGGGSKPKDQTPDEMKAAFRAMFPGPAREA